MDIKEIFAQIRALIGKAVGVEMSFGQPSKVNDLYIIPVAKTAFGFGGGLGSSGMKAKKKEAVEGEPVEETPQEPVEEVSTDKAANMGGGGGGGMHTNPIGIYSIKGEQIKFHPVISIKDIIAIMGLVFLFTLRLKKIKCKGK